MMAAVFRDTRPPPPQTDEPIVQLDPRRVSRRRAALMAGSAIVLALLTVRGRGRALDDRLFGWANSEFEHPRFDAFFRVVTELGAFYASLAAGAAIAARGRRREALDAVAAAGVMWAAGNGLKRVFRRLRPYEAQLPTPLRLLIGKPRGASWPSAHPATFLTFVTVAGRNLDLPHPGRRALVGLAGVVAASRVYLGVHYPADVIGGLLLGRATADVWSRTVTPKTVG
jgi:membrane-associated phospholipid phosphatase